VRLQVIFTLNVGFVLIAEILKLKMNGQRCPAKETLMKVFDGFFI